MYTTYNNYCEKGKNLCGVWWQEGEKFIENTFDLQKNSIKWRMIEHTDMGVNVRQSMKKEDQNRLLNMLSNYLTMYLLPNCATIITIIFNNKRHSWGHFMIAYKYNNKITYFCPQSKKKYINLKNMTRSDKNLIIIGYGYYNTFNGFPFWIYDIPIKNSTCPIKFGTPTSRG